MIREHVANTKSLDASRQGSIRNIFRTSRWSRRSKGFTLIELLVVISIISLLSSIVLSALNSARHKADDAWRLATLNNIQTALELYYQDHGYYPFGTAFSPWSKPGICAPLSNTANWRNCDTTHGDPMTDLIAGKYISQTVFGADQRDGFSSGGYLSGGFTGSSGFVYCSGNVHGNCSAYGPVPGTSATGYSQHYVLGTNLEFGSRAPSKWGNYQLSN